MVKTRRSNGETVENGEVDEGIDPPVNDVGSVSDEKGANWSQRELRSQYKVTRKIPRWPTSNKYRQRRVRTIKMSRIVFPESDTEPEKSYSKRSRKVRVFFTNAAEQTDRRAIRRSRAPRKNYANMENNYDNMHEDSEDKPIQQNVRRSCRQRKLLHHNFNESWITNELKVKGYPDLYGFGAFSSSEESFSADEARRTNKKLAHTHPPANTDEDTNLSSRLRRTSARFNTNSNKKVINENAESDSNGENNTTVIEKKPPEPGEAGAAADEPMEIVKDEGEQKVEPQDSESNQGPARSTRNRSRRRPKKDDDSESELSSESGSEITLKRQPRRSNRTRQTKPAYVEIAPRQQRGRANSFTIRKKPYSLRERKPKMLRRKTIRSQSPSSSTSSSSSDSEDTEELNVSMKNKSKGRQKTKTMDEKKNRDEKALKEIQPVELDGKVRFTSVGGLEDHIKCLREMVLFPLMYPDVFAKFNTRPAKGVLFHGPPGTGKTLLARALANECSLVGGRKVAFFMRKGADCLKKWVGESERNLKLLFQQANKMKPSIIFFDEIDALAPVRSARQDQVHTSVVGTLLAEMDGLCDRGEVVIIGATNRLDAVDPALRRAGRFDRELHFPPPHSKARRDILHIYTKDWNPRPSEETLEEIAQATTGYGGSDLKALCSEAVLKALRRVYPQVYESEHALIIDTNNVKVSVSDLQSAMVSLVAAGARSAPPPAAPLPAPLRPLLAPQVQAAQRMLDYIYTHTSADGSGGGGGVVLVSGECAETVIAPAVLARLEGVPVRELSVATLHSVHTLTVEQAVISIFSECRRADRGCVLFVREVSLVWRALGGAGGAGAALLLQLWRCGAAGQSTLLLGATSAPPEELPDELLELFPPHKQCVYRVREPTVAEVVGFLKPVVTELPLQPPLVQRTEPPPPLPRAPPPPPPRESAEETARRKRKEDYKLRELRIFLRDICRKLASNRRFYKFTKPVDLEEVTDYLDIVKQPMDLETMMTKVDQHKYNCAKDFLDDIDLICANALEYNPDSQRSRGHSSRTSSDKQIRHEACSLRDHAHALIEVEMDSDFELECQDIARKRRQEGASEEDLPDFIYTASNISQVLDGTAEAKPAAQRPNGDPLESQSAKRKRRKSAWAKGFIKRARTTPKNKDTLVMTDEDSKENKPITSTPLPNGDAMVTSSSGSDDDAPLRRPQDDTLHNHIHDSSAKSAEKSPTKTTPKKKNSGHDVNVTEKVVINKTELDYVLYKDAKLLRYVGLQRLIDLHSQLTQLVSSYSKVLDRSSLPQEMAAIVDRYVNLAKERD